MKKRVFIVFIMAFALTIGSVLVSWANAPPWPVNQKLYIPDGVFDNLTEPDCRLCHEDPNVAFNGANIPNRHHLLVENPAKHINCDFTAAIEANCPTANGKMYECLDCHSEVWNPVTYSWDLVQNFRNCLNCHVQVAGATVHHLTQAAQTSNCKKCHAPIDNPWAWELANGYTQLTKHYIPTYATTMITPKIRMGNGTNDPITPTTPASNKRGGCAFCHGPLPGASPLTDTATSIKVYDNARTHHSTGLTIGPFDPLTPTETRPTCLMCHNINTPSYNIRGCEQCHSVKSLHNIQADSPNSANPGLIVVGAETAYYGHIGANADCNGCHLNLTASASAPYSGAVIPDVFDISKYTVTAGVDTAVTVTGAALTNMVQGPTGPIVVASNVVLTAPDGSKVTLTPTPDTLTDSSLDVILPDTLAAGNYELRAVKGLWASGPIVVAVKPAVTIDSATCNNGSMVILGSGFSQNVDATNSGLGVQIGGVPCSVNLWNDTDIEAVCGTCSGTVEVSSVFGTASKIVEDLTPPPPPCSSYQYSAWSACQPNNTQTRTYTKSPDGCIENPPPVTTQTCTYIPPTCTSFTYSAWSACVNSQQTRTVISSSPTGCVGGNPVLTQTCVSNKPPVANAGPDKSANRYSSVKFDGSASKDPDGTIAKYEWNFGDGTSGSGKVVYHKYSIQKTYTVTLKVTDNIGATATDTATVTVR